MVLSLFVYLVHSCKHKIHYMSGLGLKKDQLLIFHPKRDK